MDEAAATGQQAIGKATTWEGDLAGLQERFDDIEALRKGMAVHLPELSGGGSAFRRR